MNDPSDDTIRALLLGQLPREKALPLEDRVLRDEDFCRRLDELETELIDDLARGRLAWTDRAAALRRLAVDAHGQQRLRFARALAQASESLPGEPMSPGRASVAMRAGRRGRGWPARHALFGAALAAAASLVLVVLVQHDWKQAVPDAQGVKHQTTIALLASQQRGSQSTRVEIPIDANSVRLQLEVGSAEVEPPFGVVVEQGGRALLAADDLSARNMGPYRVVELLLDARPLDGSELQVTLKSAKSDLQTWQLLIARKRPD